MKKYCLKCNEIFNLQANISEVNCKNRELSENIYNINKLKHFNNKPENIAFFEQHNENFFIVTIKETLNFAGKLSSFTLNGYILDMLVASKDFTVSGLDEYMTFENITDEIISTYQTKALTDVQTYTNNLCNENNLYFNDFSQQSIFPTFAGIELGENTKLLSSDTKITSIDNISLNSAYICENTSKESDSCLMFIYDVTLTGENSIKNVASQQASGVLAVYYYGMLLNDGAVVNTPNSEMKYPAKTADEILTEFANFETTQIN